MTVSKSTKKLVFVKIIIIIIKQPYIILCIKESNRWRRVYPSSAGKARKVAVELRVGKKSLGLTHVFFFLILHSRMHNRVSSKSIPCPILKPQQHYHSNTKRYHRNHRDKGHQWIVYICQRHHSSWKWYIGRLLSRERFSEINKFVYSFFSYEKNVVILATEKLFLGKGLRIWQIFFSPKFDCVLVFVYGNLFTSNSIS